MPSLMDLPRELRDQICNYVILAEIERPDLTQSFDTLIESRVQYHKPALEACSEVVLYLPKTTYNSSLSLLLVNRQLHSETVANLALIARCPCYSLDIIILDEILLLPTWLNVPLLSTSVDTINVTFRIAGSYDARKEFDLEMNRKGPYTRWPHYKGFVIGDGAPPAMIWQVYAVLERLIKAGPVGEVHDRNLNKHITVKCIKIDFHTPDGILKEKFVPPLSRHSSFRRRRETRNGVLDPGYLANFVESHLRGLLGGRDYTRFSCGKILFEHLNEIVFCRDGTETERWDIAEKLRNLKEVSERDYPGMVEKYKVSAWQTRRDRGLRCLDS